MGRVSLVHDESWRAARLVVDYFRPRLDDGEVTEAFLRVRAVIADAMRRLHEQSDREASRLSPTLKPANPAIPTETPP